MTQPNDAAPLVTRKVRFCCLPNSKVQVFDMATCLRTDFQIVFLATIAQRRDFAYFVILSTGEKELGNDGDVIVHPGYCKPFIVQWYDTSGAMHYARLGLDKVNRSGGSSIDATPLPFDHVVYTSRCEGFNTHGTTTGRFTTQIPQRSNTPKNLNSLPRLSDFDYNELERRIVLLSTNESELMSCSLCHDIPGTWTCCRPNCPQNGREASKVDPLAGALFKRRQKVEFLYEGKPFSGRVQAIRKLPEDSEIKYIVRARDRSHEFVLDESKLIALVTDVDEETESRVARHQSARLACEVGYRACEKGKSIQAALAEIDSIYATLTKIVTKTK